VALTLAVFAGTAAVPWIRTRVRAAAHLHRAVTSGDEHWDGLVIYTGAYALLTAVGLTGDPLPAAAALLALSLGDGVGGAVGRRFGRIHYRAPGGKRKSVEGSLTVALGAAAAALAAARVLGTPLDLTRAVAAGVGAAAAEAAAPRGTDNALVPGAAWLCLSLMT
jgi:dolichol kinase